MMKPIGVSLIAGLVAVGAVAMMPEAALVEGQLREGGIPVTNQAVIESCAACHAVDDQGMMSRISYMRKTPEGWQASLHRMVGLQGLQIEPEQAQEIVRYLSNEHGLAPEELRPGLWDVERRTRADRYPHEVTLRTCTACHSMGRTITQRRSAEEWDLLMDTHRGYYPLIDNQRLRSNAGFGPSAQHPVEEALEHLREAYPLQTAAWAAWSASARTPRLEGRWTLEGWEPARGPVFGTLEIQAVAGSPEQFTTRATYHYPREGTHVVREGEARVYTGYQWRGRSQETSESSAPPATAEVSASGELREVMFLEPGQGELHGRWFTGAHDELGLEVRLRRARSDPVVAGVYPRMLRSGGGEQEVRVYGANLPESAGEADLDLGPGVELVTVESAHADSLIVRVRVEEDSRTGHRTASVNGATLTDALVVFDRVDYMKVEPEAGMARIGGIAMPRQFERYEAIGYHAGADGVPGTELDIRIGPLDVAWELAEYPLTFADDDAEFVGTIDGSGLFTPGIDGPNPERPGNRNNMGDVWVVARYTPPDGEGPALEARGYLLVTTPIYIRWDPSEVMEGPGMRLLDDPLM